MTKNSTIIIPMDDLIAGMAEWKNGHSKSFAIVRSSSAILSVIASSLLIWMMSKSKSRLSTTYHRLLLGMSVGDILYSLSYSTFQVMSPSDLSYMVWNARGNEATCSAHGFFVYMGLVCSLLYSCSLNLYCLAKVKYNKTDLYIRTKIEPFLHGVPILAALILSITWLVKNNYNDFGGGYCTGAPIYNPQHCIGYDKGEVREGFKIPCGRGRDENIYFVFVYLLWCVCPIVIGVSLGMIYRSVQKQEQRIARYGAGALNPSATGGSGDSGERVSRNFSVRSSVSSVLASTVGCFRRNSSPNGENSRAVLNRALAYSAAYFLAWIWPFAGYMMKILGKDVSLAYAYTWTILNALQGLFNFLVFMHPKVMSAKKSQGGNLSWCEAFAQAFWPGGSSGNKKNTPADYGSKKNARRADYGDEKDITPVAHSGGKEDTSANILGGTNTSSNGNRRCLDVEEEKTEIQAHQGNDAVEMSRPTKDYEEEHDTWNENPNECE